MFKLRKPSHESEAARNARIARFYPQTAETYTTEAFIHGWRSLLYSVAPIGLHELVGDALAGGVAAEVVVYGGASIPLAISVIRGLNSAVCAVRRHQLTGEPILPESLGAAYNYAQEPAPAPEHPQQVAPIPQLQIDVVPQLR